MLISNAIKNRFRTTLFDEKIKVYVIIILLSHKLHLKIEARIIMKLFHSSLLTNPFQLLRSSKDTSVQICRLIAQSLNSLILFVDLRSHCFT